MDKSKKITLLKNQSFNNHRLLFLIFFLLNFILVSSQVKPAPDRSRGEGPFDRLIIRGATLIDGTGGMPRGPVDIVIEENKIVDIKNVGTPKLPIENKNRPTGATKEIDA